MWPDRAHSATGDRPSVPSDLSLITIDTWVNRRGRAACYLPLPLSARSASATGYGLRDGSHGVPFVALVVARSALGSHGVMVGVMVQPGALSTRIDPSGAADLQRSSSTAERTRSGGQNSFFAVIICLRSRCRRRLTFNNLRILALTLTHLMVFNFASLPFIKLCTAIYKTLHRLPN